MSLAEKISEIRKILKNITTEDVLDEFQKNALDYLFQKLCKMESECRSGNLTPQEQRFSEIARIVVESDPRFVPPDLGGKLIEVEKEYQKLA